MNSGGGGVVERLQGGMPTLPGDCCVGTVQEAVSSPSFRPRLIRRGYNLVASVHPIPLAAIERANGELAERKTLAV